MILSIFLGIGLAASAGFRVFLPLFVLSIASYTNLVELNASWQWMGNISALLVFGVATLTEIFAYSIPWVDNLLDSLAIPLAALAGTAVMVSTLTGMDPVITWSLAIIAGGGTATAIKGAAAGSRMASTIGTGGLANPAVSVVETAMATIISWTSVLVPLVAIILVIVVLALVLRVYRKLRPRRGGTQ